MKEKQLTPQQWLDIVRDHDKDGGDGKWLEDLVSQIGPKIVIWDFEKVYSWKDWPGNPKLFPDKSRIDVGIDNVGVRPDGTYVAIQCKARPKGSKLTKNDVKDFLTAATSQHWVERWIVTTATVTKNVSDMLRLDVDRPVKIVDYENPLEELILQEVRPLREDEELTSMQNEAVTKIVRLLKEHSEHGRPEWNRGEARGHIVMPCGTGKTRVSYRVMKEIVKPGEVAVVLVPSIALVSQIKGDYQRLAKRDEMKLRTLAVCSDQTAGRRRSDEDTISIDKDRTVDAGHVTVDQVVGETALNEDQVTNWLARPRFDNERLVLFSTYQSAHNTANGLKRNGLVAKLMIGDEAHRTAGIRKVSNSPKHGERIRNFTLCHDKDMFPAKFRLYQTATPRIFSTQTVDEIVDSKWEVKSMNDERTFGKELFRLGYKEAVKRNLLSDYRIIALAMGDRESEVATRVAEQLNKQAVNDKNKPEWTTGKALRALGLAAFLGGAVPTADVKSVIAFCNRIKISKELVNALESEPVRLWVKEYLQSIQKVTSTNPPEKLYQLKHIDATHRMSQRESALKRLALTDYENPFCISNVGIFGEGTDSPDLSAVAFVEPRRSPIDVIQAVGRVMRKSPRKALGFIFVPIVIPPRQIAEDYLRRVNSETGWKELGQILQALRAHDGRIEDELEDLMELWLPAESKESRDHFIVLQEPRRPPRYFVKTTPDVILNLVSTVGKSSPLERLEESRGQLTEIKDPSTLNKINIPSSCTAIRTKQNGTVVARGFVPQEVDYDSVVVDTERVPTWNPEATAAYGVKIIEADRKGVKPMPPVPPSKPPQPPPDIGDPLSTDPMYQLGESLLKLGGKSLKESGIHLNLLERSGILTGPRRDINLLEVTVNAIAHLLREEQLESTLATALNMTRLEQDETKKAADACAVTAVLWVNAAIMHARLDSTGLSALKKVPKLSVAVADTNPAKGIAKAWQSVLTKDYVPIFEVANELLMEVAFLRRAGVGEALSRMAKDAIEIADNYAGLGMDHAGELFNRVMGNQRSDGAFFTRPIAASLLSELTLYATEEAEWTEESTWERLRCFDPACGSGTLLVAMIQAIKHRILQTKLPSEEKEKILSRFHRQAVEEYVIGADINPVSLQLAGCQLTLGEVSALYEKINLYHMEYGLAIDAHPSVQSVRTGTPELLLDPRLIEMGEEHLELENPAISGQQMSLTFNTDPSENDELVKQLEKRPPRIIMMNPPYTPWRDCGEKFGKEIQHSLRQRMAGIWDFTAEYEPMLRVKKASIAALFETLAIHLTRRNKGVFAIVSPLVFLLMTSARERRAAMARKIHIESILTCHDPKNTNMSWDTSINECLIVGVSDDSRMDLPTKIINLDTMPSTSFEAYEVVRAAMEGDNFDGSVIQWEYENMRQGDWSPSSFRDAELAELIREAVDGNENICYNWGGQMESYTIRYLEVLLTSRWT
ncbi:MAG: DEAD/DEAH box helicase family protein [Gammaproteobacteria bacterium]|nr:DEAD/DEAH box helicase family protein [Gammaproteobacteria bacterium]MDE0403166.1 DEAD/DEAH box helicase family protein [Gammaproteobacteria bacterium]